MIYTSLYFQVMYIIFYIEIFLFSLTIVFHPFQVIKYAFYTLFSMACLCILWFIYQDLLFENQVDYNFAPL